MPLVRIPDKGLVRFPDDMTPEQIQAAIRIDIMGEKELRAPEPTILDRVKGLLPGGGTDEIPGYPTGFFERRIIPEAAPETPEKREQYWAMPPKKEKAAEAVPDLKAPESRLTEELKKQADLYAKSGLESRAGTMYMMAGLGRLIEESGGGNFGTWLKQIYQKEAESNTEIADSLRRDPANTLEAINQKIVQGALGLLDPQLALMPLPAGYGAARALTQYGMGEPLPASLVKGMESALVAKGFGLSHGMKPLEAGAKVGALGATEAAAATAAAGGTPKEAALAGLEGGTTAGLFAATGAAKIGPAGRKVYEQLSPSIGHEKALEIARTVEAEIVKTSPKMPEIEKGDTTVPFTPEKPGAAQAGKTVGGAGGVIEPEKVAADTEIPFQHEAGKTGTRKASGDALAFAPEAGFRRQPESSKPIDTPQKRSEIVKTLSEKLDIPIRTGRFMHKALGIFKPRSEVIRTGKANDIEVISHEIGHALQKFLWPEARTPSGALSNKPFKAFSGELVPLATKPRAGQPVEPEGFAEFVRLYVTNPDLAREKAPGFYEFFEKELDGRSPESKEILLEARRMYDRWLKQPEIARVIAQISVGEKEKPRRTFDDLYTATIDDLHPLQEAVKEMAKGEKLKGSRNPYVLARLMRGWTGKAEHFLERSPFKFDTYENVGKPLKEILKPVEKDLDTFRAYLVSKRALELSGRKIETGILEADARKVVADHEAKLEPIRQEVLEYQDHTLQYLKDSGMISDTAYAAMKAANKEYIPFYRVMEEGKKGYGVGKGMEARQATKRIKGSWRDIVDPLESIIKNTYVYINAAEKNAVGRALVDLAESKEGLGKYVEKIPTPMQGIKVSPDEISRVLKQISEKTDLEIEDLDGILEDGFSVFRPTAFVPKDNIISVWKNGKRELYQVHPDIARTFQALDKESVNTIIRLLSYPARLLRAGATLTPEFIGRNPVRDQLSAFIYSKYGYVPGFDFLKGIFHVAKKDSLFWDWQKSGGAHSMLVSMDRDYLQKNLKQVLKKHPRVESAVKNPIEALRILSELTESGTRLGEFGKGLKKEGRTKEGMQAAAFASREVTLDFARMGAKTKAVNMIVAFWNANLQGHDKMIRAFKANPVTTSAKVAASITLPSLLLAYANHDDPRYKEIPRWQKDLFWIVITDDTIWRIPKPFELGILFGSIPERAMEYILDKDPDAFRDMDETFENFIPSILPTVAVPLIENWANKSYFMGGPLVPEGKKDLLSKYQYTTRTSETAKLLGKIIDKISITPDPSLASPAKIENLIRGWSGGLGKYALDASDYVLESAGAISPPPKPEKTKADMPFVKGFVVRYPSSTSASISKFYDDYQKASKIISTAKYLAEKEGKGLEARELLLTNNAIKAEEVYSALRMLSAFTDNIQNNPTMSPAEKRKLIDQAYMHMKRIAAEGNKTLKLVKALKKYAGEEKQ